MQPQYMCKGPLETLGERRVLVANRIKPLKATLDSLDTDDPAAMSLITKLDELEQWQDQHSELPDNHNLGRMGCGYDMTVIIAAIPADGDVYHYCCPSCGNTGNLRKTQVDKQSVA